MASSTKLLVGGGVLIALVGSFFIGGSKEVVEPPRSAPRHVVAPAATAVREAPRPEPVLEPKIEPREAPPVARGLAMSDSLRLREAALEDVERFEKAGRFQEALDSIDDAIQNGADKTKLEAARVRLRALAEEGRKLDDAFAKAELATSNGEHDAALRALEGARELATRLGRRADLDERVRRATDARDRASALQKGLATIAKAQELLDLDDLAGARAEVEKARGLVPGSQDLAQVETRLHALEKLPEGFVYVPLSADKALYVRKDPVSNADFKAWIDATGRSGAAPWSTYPETLAGQPVKGAFVDAARNFAAARGERLPADDEWPAIAKALHLSELKAKAGVFADGFLTVKAP